MVCVRVEGIVPRQGIDTDAKWVRCSPTKEEWAFGYKFHRCNTNPFTFIIVVLVAGDVLRLLTYRKIRFIRYDSNIPLIDTNRSF